MQPPTTKLVKLRSPDRITTRQAIRAAGSAVRLARALEITKGAVAQWGTHPPLRHQERIIELYQQEKP